MLKLLVFDLDGTLVDTRADIVNSVNRALVQSGYPALAFETVLGGIGDGARNLLESSLWEAKVLQATLRRPETEILSLKTLVQNVEFSLEVDQVLNLFLDDYEVNCMIETVVYPGVLASLAQLNGYTKAVLTNKPDLHTQRILKALKLDSHFTWIVGGDNKHGAKPNPAALEEILAKAGAAPSEAAMIGDGIQDYSVAENAKTHFIGFLRGIGNPQALLDQNAKITIESMEFLPEAIERLNQELGLNPLKNLTGIAGK